MIAKNEFYHTSLSIQSNEFNGTETELQFRIIPLFDNGNVFIDNIRLTSS